MPLFLCDNCGKLDNTAGSNYWTRNLDFNSDVPLSKQEKKDNPALCTVCDPDIDRDEDAVELATPEEMKEVPGEDGFHWPIEGFKNGQITHTKPDPTKVCPGCYGTDVSHIGGGKYGHLCGCIWDVKDKKLYPKKRKYKKKLGRRGRKRARLAAEKENANKEKLKVRRF